MATAILPGVTAVSRAPALVLDVENGYFDRLLLTAVRRLAILLGHLLADVTVAFTLTVPIVILAFGPGVSRRPSVSLLPRSLSWSPRRRARDHAARRFRPHDG